MFFSKSLAVFALALSASALTTPHIARDLHHRRAAVLAHREAQPEPIAQPIVTPRKRSSHRKRCAVEPSSPIAPSSSPVVASSSIPVPSSSAVPVNVAPSAPIAVSSAPVLAPAPTSEAPAPAPTSEAPPPAPTSEAPAPAPTSSPAPPPAPSPAPSPVSSAAPPVSTGSNDLGFPFATGQTYYGDATWYETGLGACGITNTDTDYIVAVSEVLFDSYPGYNGANPNDNPVCNKQIKMSYGGSSVTVTVTDRCVACNETSIDMSPSAFSQLASQSVGRLTEMSWEWV